MSLPPGPEGASHPAEHPGAVPRREAVDHEVDEQGGVVPLTQVGLEQVSLAELTSTPASGGERPPVFEHRRADVDADHVVPGRGQPDRIQPGAAAGIEQPRRWAGKQAAQPAHMTVDLAEPPAGTVVALVEVLAEQAPANLRSTPVELHRGVPGIGPVGNLRGNPAAHLAEGSRSGGSRRGRRRGPAAIARQCPAADAAPHRQNRRMSNAVIHLVETGGLVAVFVLMFAESCGIPAPSEVIMPFAGAFAAAGHLSLAGAILAGALGNLGGSLLAWALAARYGEPLLLGPGRRVGVRPGHLASADRWFQRHGLLAVFLGRLLPVIRTYISFPAGLARVEPVRFSVLTFVGALPWCAALAVAGYQVRNNYDRISKPITYAAYALAVAALVALVVWFVQVRRRAAARAA